MTNQPESPSGEISVLLADSKPMEAQLLAAALQHRGVRVLPCDHNVASILEVAEQGNADVAVLSPVAVQFGALDLNTLRTLHFSRPQLPKILVMEAEDRELVVQAFRSGARGLFCLADSSFQAFCECIEKVYCGGIWATTQQLNYLLDSVCQVPALR